MSLRTRFRAQSAASKVLAVAVTTVVSALVVFFLRYLPGTSNAMGRLDDVFYDAMYGLRPVEDRTKGNVAVITLDDASLDALKQANIYWPVPRDWWGMTIGLLEKCGAKVVAFDVVFPDPSVYQKYEDDDRTFAAVLDSTKMPVVLGIEVDPPADRPKGATLPGRFDVPVKRTPVFGAVNIDYTVLRQYKPGVYGVPSLAAQAAALAGTPARDWASRPFRVHYYGPHAGSDGKPLTYRYVPAWSVFVAAKKLSKGKSLAECGIDPTLFRDKVVVVGYTAQSLEDLKTSPVSNIYPGVEYQATAIDNLMQNQHVLAASKPELLLATLAIAFLASIAVTLPRHAGLKFIGAALALAALLGSALAAFLGHEIHWLPLASPLLAWLLATIAAFAWSHFTEGRQRQQIVRAFSQVLSPELVAQIERDPHQLDPGGERREMTVMFTDLAGFTTLTEKLENHRLVELLNFYFEEMAPLILDGLGTLDKYIGDAIMSFWNAPVPQADHAALACKAALRMAAREKQMQSAYQERGADRLLTRIGINTGPMIVGFTGSGKRLSYSVLGDSVNFGSRLEGANKLYGSQILISEATAQLVKDRFTIRRLDVLRVKGKQQPMAVYELMGEGPGDAAQRRLASLYESALEAHQKQRWDEAEASLAELLKDFPTDAPATALAHRIADLRKDPPAHDWDGVYVAHEK